MLSLLVAEPDADVRDLLAETLSRAGYTVHTAVDGPSALALAAANAVDLAVSEARLGSMSGLSLCADLRRRPDRIGLPFILLSTLTRAIDQAVGLAGGADDYITKPFSPADVVLRVHATIARKRRLARTAAKASHVAARASVNLFSLRAPTGWR